MNLSLLSALPHSWPDVESALRDPRKDYVRSILRLGPSSSVGEPAWLKVQPVLEIAAAALFGKCREWGVPVVCGAGRCDLARAARTSDVVIILAHWKGHQVWPSPPDLQRTAFGMESVMQQCIQRRLLAADKTTAQLQGLSERQARDHVAGWLNEAIDGWENWLPYDELLEDGASAAFISSAFGRSHARSIIDDIFGPDDLLPGARLELADGLWRPADIASCFPQGWSGVCDFFCCTSEYLADLAKCRHPGAVFRADSRLLKPAWVIEALQEMIPHFLREAPAADDLASLYMGLAYQYDSKFGDN